MDDTSELALLAAPTLPRVEPTPNQVPETPPPPHDMPSATRSRRTSSTRRHVNKLLLLVVVVGCGVGGWVLTGMLIDRSSEEPAGTDVAAVRGSEIDIGVMAFWFPSDADLEVIDDVQGVNVQGWAWQAGSGDDIVQVLVMQFPEDLSRDAAVGGLESMTAGVARRGEGRTESSRTFDEPDGVVRHQAAVQVEDGYLIGDSQTRGRVIVSVLTGSSSVEPSADHVTIVESIRWGDGNAVVMPIGDATRTATDG
jgi:hypothetical protein